MGGASWTASASVEVGDGHPDQREAALVDHRPRVGEEVRAARVGAAGSRPSAARRVRRARGPGEVVEAQPEHDRVADDARRPRAGGPRGRRARRASPRSRSRNVDPDPSARCAPIDRRRRPGCTGRGSRLCASAWRWCPDARTEHADERLLAERGHFGHGGDAAVRGASAAVLGPTPQRMSTAAGAGTRARASGGTTSRPSGLATRARHLGEELRPGHTDRDAAGRPARARRAAARAAMSAAGPATRRSPPTSRKASSIEIPSTSGVVSLEDLEHRPARFGVGRHPRLDHDRLRAQLPGLPPAHRAAHAERPGLVARGHHDAAAHDDRPAPEPRVVALLDRREERVEVGVEDRGDGTLGGLRGHEHMFAQVDPRPPAPGPAGRGTRMLSSTVWISTRRTSSRSIVDVFGGLADRTCPVDQPPRPRAGRLRPCALGAARRRRARRAWRCPRTPVVPVPAARPLPRGRGARTPAGTRAPRSSTRSLPGCSPAPTRSRSDVLDGARIATLALRPARDGVAALVPAGAVAPTVVVVSTATHLVVVDTAAGRARAQPGVGAPRRPDRRPTRSTAHRARIGLAGAGPAPPGGRRVARAHRGRARRAWGWARSRSRCGT